VQIAILGPLAVADAAGAPREIAGLRLRTLLARLALDPGRVVALGALVDAVWGDEPPAEETNALQTLVSRLRRTLGAGAIVQAQGGYRLAVEPEHVDAVRFERLAGEGATALRSGNHRRAAQLLSEALGLWRGPALVDVAGEGAGSSLAAAAVRLEDLRIAAVLDRIDADLELSDPTALVPELEGLAAQHPLHERLAGQLIRALAASGRQADALAVYEGLRNRLADELGVDPSAELRQVHLDLLRGALPGPRVQAPAQRRTNLKAQLTSFVGREDEVARIAKSLEQHRLVTLVGPGGAGKTRLAGEAAGGIVDSAQDGVWMVELAQVTTGNDVPQAVLSSIGLREAHLLDRRGTLSGRDVVTRLVEGLVDKQAIVLLDNCEHVIEAAARLTDHLLAECPGLRVLATSREPLGIFGEVLLAVPPLGRPSPNTGATEAMEYPAVRLFADRAAAVRPEFEVRDGDVAIVVEIVRRLDGLPLAIELAAARLRTMPLDEIAARLSDRFRLLTGGSRTALPRHRTLRAVVEWSWDLLSAEERTLAEQLAVFPSGITADSAAAVCRLDRDDAADQLASLIDKSLLQPLDGGRRLRMLETIREYGAERLAERGELGELRARHAAYFADLLADAQPKLTTADQLPSFAKLAAERENVVAAMRYYCDTADADPALTMAVGLATYAMMLGIHAEITTWVSDALAVPGGDPQLRTVARALLALNTAATGASVTDVEQSLRGLGDLARELAELDVVLNPMAGLLRCAVAFFAGDKELTERFMQETLDSGDPWARASVLMFRANMNENDGDVEGMRRDTELAMAAFGELGERWGLASTLRSVGALFVLDGRLDEAADAFREALRIYQEFESREDEGFLMAQLADIELRRGDFDSARRYLIDAQERAEENGAMLESVFTLAIIGSVEREAGNHERARELHREAMRRITAMPEQHPAQGHMRAILLGTSARIAFDDGELETAEQFAREAFAAGVATKDMPIVATIGVMLADVTARTDPEEAALMLGASARLRGADDPTACDIRRVTAVLTDALGEARFAELYAQGKALDREAAVERLAPR